jgi:hypothetical protein
MRLLRQVLSLHEAAASSAFSSLRRYRNRAVREIVVLSDVRRTGVIILAIAVCSKRAALCIKRSGMIRLQPTCPVLARPARPLR